MKTLIVLVALSCNATILFAQSSDRQQSNGPSQFDAAKNAIKTDADLTSGNSQDVLTSFFQLAYNDLTGNSHQFQFNSSLFAVKAKTNPALKVDTNYLRQTFARNFNFGVAYKMDSTFKFQSAALNLKYAIINKRDTTVVTKEMLSELSHYQSKIQTMLQNFDSIYYGNDSNKDRSATTNFFQGVKPLKDLPNDAQDLIKKLVDESDFKKYGADKFISEQDSIYKRLIDAQKQRALWTIAGNLYSDENRILLSQANFETEFLLGIKKSGSKKMSNVELDLKADFNLADDTTSVAKDINRQILSGSAGINWIIARTGESRKSLFECKFDGTASLIFSGGYAGEDKFSYTLNATPRIRITDDVWIPIVIKYDPVNANVFGFLNVTANFAALGKKSSGN